MDGSVCWMFLRGEAGNTTSDTKSNMSRHTENNVPTGLLQQIPREDYQRTGF